MAHLAPPVLQQATPDDEAAVAQMFVALHHQNAALDPRFALAAGWRDLLHRHFLHTWDAPGACWVLAWAATTPVGLIVLEAHTDSPIFRYRHWVELVALYVSPAYRGSGLSDRLVAHGLAWARQHGFERVQLYVTASNQQAQACYRRCGFVPVQQIWRCDLHPPGHRCLWRRDPLAARADRTTAPLSVARLHAGAGLESRWQHGGHGGSRLDGSFLVCRKASSILCVSASLRLCVKKIPAAAAGSK